MSSALEQEVERLTSGLRVSTDPQVAERLEALTPLLLQADEPLLAARVFLARAMIAFAHRRDLADAQRLVEHGLARVSPDDDTLLWARLLNTKALLLMMRGDLFAAIEPLLQAELRSRSLGHSGLLMRALALGNLGSCLLTVGDRLGGIKVLEEALALPLDVAATFTHIQCMAPLANAYALEGEQAKVREVTVRMRSLMQDPTDLAAVERVRAEGLMATCEARLALFDGRLSEAAAQADRSAELLGPFSDRQELARAYLIGAQATLQLGDLERADLLAHKAEQAAGGHPSPQAWSEALELRAEIAERQGQLQRAIDLLRSAQRGDSAHIRRGLGEAVRALVNHYNDEINHLRHNELRSANDSLRAALTDLRIAKDAAEQAVRARHDFLSQMSHEIRTPLHGVLGSTHLLSNTPLAPDQRETLEVARRSAELTLAIVDDILDFRTLEEGRLELDPVPFPLRRPARDAVRMVLPRAADKGLTLELHIEQGLPERVIGDDRRLQQVLVNLLANAVKFTSQGHVTLELSAHPQGIQFSVTDTGIGIAPEALGRIFQPYTQSDASTRRRAGGTGLGLTISRSLVALAGGALQVESTLGVGSRFHFAVPLPAHSSQEAGPEALEDIRGMRVLVAEDNPVNRLLIERMLQDLGVTVHCAEGGSDAVHSALRQRPHVVLMDLHMPDMDGDEATRRLREAGYPGPILALTASVLAEDREVCLSAGMDGFLTKPLTPSALCKALAPHRPAQSLAPQSQSE